MVVERIHETDLAPDIIFNAIKARLPPFEVAMQTTNRMRLRYINGNISYYIDVNVMAFENLNRVIVQSISYTTGLLGSITNLAVENQQADFVIKSLMDFENEVQNLRYMHQQRTTSDKQQMLLNSVKVMVPTHMESDTQSSILVKVTNPSPSPITNFYIAFPEVEDFFIITGELRLVKIMPGMEIEQSFVIKPKFQKGTFPLNVMINGNDVTANLNYFIKVGGTEVY